MTANWIYALVAGASVVTIGCQPLEPDYTPTVQPPTPQAIDRETRKLDERVARHQARWAARRQQFASSER